MELPKLSENLQKRILSAGILIPVVLVIAVLGGNLFNSFIVLAATIMAFEWSGIITSGKEKLKAKEQKYWEFGGIAYVTIFASSLMYLRSVEGGFGIILLVLLFVWATDIAAYFAGRIIGGPKIYTKISPNKTWAGLAGGMLAAGFVGAFASIFIHSFGFFSMVIIGAFLAIIAQSGDFLESWVKRKFGVKDSGSIIPGHGGIMDRVDGLVTVAPVFAIISLLKGGNFF